MVCVKKHYDEIDIYKGIAILLIIFGHSFCVFPIDFTKTDLISVQSMVALFNLNMFMVASGVLFSLKESWHNFIAKKTNRLIIPWITFSIVMLLMKKIFSSFTHGNTGSFLHELLLEVISGKSYWFLYALMIMMVITKLIKNKKVLTVIGGGILMFQYWFKESELQCDILCLNRLIQYFPWFIAGFLLKDFYSYITSEISRCSFYILFPTSIIMLIILVVSVLYELNNLFVIGYILLPSVECVAFLILSITIKQNGILNKFFSQFGKYSLQYYLNHLLIMLACYYVGACVFDITHLGALGIIFTCAVFISWLMLLVEMKIPIFRKLCGFV